MINLIPVIRKLSKITFYLSTVIFIVFLFWTYPLPGPSSLIFNQLSPDPIQTKVQLEPFIKDIKGQTYKITPLFSYDIRGLVVSDYDSQNWLDFSHKGDPAQTKDLCLIWGDNLKNGIYSQLEYRHGEFTCYVNWKNRSVASKFNQNQFSNNHIIPSTDQIAARMKSTGVGDQVSVKGLLINYQTLDDDGQVKSYRNTSTIREDHDCEIIWVTDYQILKQPPFPYYQIKQILPVIIFWSGLINLLLIGIK